MVGGGTPALASACSAATPSQPGCEWDTGTNVPSRPPVMILVLGR